MMIYSFYFKGQHFCTQLELINLPTQLIGETVPFQIKVALNRWSISTSPILLLALALQYPSLLKKPSSL